MPLTHDIWHEVLEYFRYDLTFDYDKERHERMQDILNIALVSRSLTAVALDALWAQMGSLEPVANVVNSFALPSKDIYLDIVGVVSGQSTEWHWELRRPIEDDTVRFRAQGYLDRIRTFWINELDLTESSLWPILAACFGKKVLLPNLRRLGLKSGVGSFPLAVNTIPLLSPVLTTLTIDHNSASAGAALMLFRLLKSDGCRLKRIEYVGSSSPDLLHTFMAFKDLEILLISHRQGHRLQRESSTLSYEILSHFASLNTLQVDLRIFPSRQALLSQPIHHHALVHLHLTGATGELEDFLLNITSPSVHHLLLVVCEGGGPPWKILCEQVASSFPRLHSFSLQSTLSEARSLIRVQDLPATLLKPLTELSLVNLCHRMTADDFDAMLKLLPNLRALAIVPKTECFSASVLVPLSQQSHLCRLHLRLHFATPIVPLLDAGLPSKNRLEELGIFDPKGFPSALEGRIVLAQNLLGLFPRLRTVVHNSKEVDGIADLQKLITALSSRAAICHCNHV